ncbi:NADP-dependent oxidoreductase domain-containing protein 1 [Ambystoma mexicanum]|uniref:NADP-dependent oxidoreductase domain-containing protein 1 n=1 Tax=Ambystoma mexicanum TaxID=8296 RepID=UPI0037E7326E
MSLDFTSDLRSFQFERGVDFSHQHLLPLRERSKGLMVTACAHAVFFCKLLHTMKQEGRRKVCLPSGKSLVLLGYHREWLKVGIIGGGHTGRQLAGALRELSGVPAEDIRISTRRPETLKDLQALGMDCFYNNVGVVAWADVLFLCCLPSHLPTICSEIHSAIPESCIVYSLVSTVPIARLKQLLSHKAIIRPKYRCEPDPHGFQWGAYGDTNATLRIPAAVRATSPWSTEGGIAVNASWFGAVLYAALNSCKAWNLAHKQSLKLLNDLINRLLGGSRGEQNTYPRFVREDFINKAFASSMAEDVSFPWFDLTVVQTKETPLSRLFTSSPQLLEHLSCVYCASFQTPTEESTESCLTASSLL